MATNAASKLQEIRRVLKQIATEAPQASSAIDKINAALAAMEARPAPKNVGFAFPKFDEVRQLAEGFRQLDNAVGAGAHNFQRLSRYARESIREIKQIQINMERAGVSMSRQKLLPARAGMGRAGIPSLDPNFIDQAIKENEERQAKLEKSWTIYQPKLLESGEPVLLLAAGDALEHIAEAAPRAAAGLQEVNVAARTGAAGGAAQNIPNNILMPTLFGAYSGKREHFPAPLPITGDISNVSIDMLESEHISETAAIAIEALEKKYTALGFSVKDASIELKANSKELEIQATLAKQLDRAYEATIREQTKVSLETGKVTPDVDPTKGLSKLLGPQRFAEFEKQLKKLGFSMSDMGEASIEGVNKISRFTFTAGKSGEATRTVSFHFDRFGRSLGNMSNRFKSFEQALAANITKVLQWGVATTVVWGAVRQLTDAFQQLIVTQDAMATLSITTGESMDKMGYYFEKVSDVATAAGVDISDTMKGIDIAIRVGEGATEAERTASSFEFLADAAAYAKLSNLDMAKSSDILIASLKQMGMAITEGDVLLNKWVAVSRATNVSLVDLGQAYATTAAAADSAGVSVDELNAYIGVFALTTNKSAQESANALRAMFSAIQTPSAQKALEGYGIAVKTANGELRDMPDILDDINVLLDVFGRNTARGENAMSKLAYVLGGQGARRQADFVSFLKEYNKTRELTNRSESAEGELQEALAKKTDTLKTSITNLKNAFTELGQTLGTEGGLLETLTYIVEKLSDALSLFKDISSAVGPATTAIAAFTAAWALNKQLAIGPRIGEQFGKLGIGGGGVGGMDPALAIMAQGQAMAQEGGFGATAMHGIKMAGPGLFAAGTHIAQGITGSMEWDEVGARSGGAIAGAFVGNMIMPGAGGLIGTYIGEAFVGKALEGIEQEKEAFVVPIAEMDLTQLERARDLLKEEIKETAPSETPGWVARTPIWGAGLADERRIEAAERLREIEEEISNLRKEEVGEDGAPQRTPAYAARYTQYQRYIDDLETQFTQRKKEMPLEFAAGDIGSAREYASELERMENLSNSMLPIFDATVLSLQAQGEEVGSLGDLFTEMGTEMASWSDESLSFIQSEALAIKQLETDIANLTAEINNNTDALDHAEQHAIDMMRAELSAMETDLETRTAGFEDIREGVAKQERIRAYGPIPGFQQFDDTTKEEFQGIISRARELQAQFGEQLSIPPEVFESIDAWAAMVGGNFEWVEGVLQQFVSQAKTEFEDYKSSQDDAFNVRRLKDVDPSKMGEIAAGNRYWIEYLSRIQGMSAQQYLEAEGEQFNLILGEENVFQQIFSTAEAMQFTLQDILETEEKQLEGMWNIPSGATWFVPITSLFYQKGEGMGYPELAPLIDPTERTADSTKGTKVAAEKTVSGISKLVQLWGQIGLGPGYGPIDPELLEEVNRMIQPSIAPGYEFPEVTLSDEMLAMMGALPREPIEPVERPPKELDETFWTKMLKKSAELPWSSEHEERRLQQYMDIEPPAPAEVSVEIPPIDGTFRINNVVTLDGRVLFNTINEIIARALTKTIGATGHSNSKPGR